MRVPISAAWKLRFLQPSFRPLADAVLYLADYPFECAEQRASRIVAIASLADVLNAFTAEEMPSPDTLRTTVEMDLKTLAALQNGDGGFGFWRRGELSLPYSSPPTRFTPWPWQRRPASR